MNNRTTEVRETISVALKRLNNAQRGSFGELIFASVAGGLPDAVLETVRRNRADFLLNSVAIDVKTSIRNITGSFAPLLAYRGPRVPGVRYAQVEFAVEGVRVSIEEQVLGTFDWTQIQTWWDNRPRQPARARTSNAATDMDKIREQIVAHFSTYGFETRVLYRTIQAEFRNESPANLLPTKIRRNRFNVFVDFAGPHLVESNIRRIFAFEDFVAAQLPTLERHRLHKAKVDLDRIPERYVFKTLAELFERAPKR